MAKIHQVIETQDREWTLDPVKGAVQAIKTTLRPADTWAISHGGKVYKIDKNTGAFDVPAEVANHYLRLPGWHPGDGIPIPPTPEELAVIIAARARGEDPDAKPEKKTA